MSNEFTIQHAIESLGGDLKGYLEAQYHIRDEGLLRERRLLLDEPGVIVQRPFLEATPSYELSDPFDKLPLPDYAKTLLTSLAKLDVGIYPQPYIHQAKGVEAFLAGKDVMAATGTGSGKTEIFLFSILGMLAEEGAKRRAAVKTKGMRALILYPMNALVADQLARIRRIFGNEKVKAELVQSRGRHATFGMYTGRTPFPGLISEKKKDAAALLKNYYRPIFENQKLLEELNKRGKWPAKDVMKFFGEGLWENRLQTDPDDAELLMRHEMQQSCPDILVTNYSMLEYMLLRPIEKSIFDQTAAYLKTPGTYLTIVMDEAHMYRGATGAEVAFLLRRLRARLGVSRDKLRFILTTASVGSEKEHRDAASIFAADLTGASDALSISFVTGQKEAHPCEPRSATLAESLALEAFDVTQFHQVKAKPEDLSACLNPLVKKLGLHAIETASGDTDEKKIRSIQAALYDRCRNFGPANKFLGLISGNATERSVAADDIFPENKTKDGRLAGLDALATIGNFAKETKTNKVFLPARLHLFFKGLSGVFACVNPDCSERRDKTPGSLFGKLHPEPLVTCGCGARVFELLTHRDCGAAFVRAYADRDGDPTFLWHEPTSLIGANGKEMREMQIHFSHEVPEFPEDCKTAWLQVDSGKIVWEEPALMTGWRAVYFPVVQDSPEIATRFLRCVACDETAQNDTIQVDRQSRIMDLRTKGEQPFSQLVKRQMFCQPADETKSKDDFPNQGRKVLLFSDGRQKAARLAKNIPEEVESDGMRQLLAVAYRKVTGMEGDPKNASLNKLYLAFVSACLDAHVYLFDGQDASSLRQDITKLRDDYTGDFADYWGEANPVPPIAFKEKLYRQASGGLYSLRFMVAGWLEPKSREFRKLAERLSSIAETDLKAFCTEWIQAMARVGDLDHTLTTNQRARIVAFPKDGGTGKLPRKLLPLFEKIKGTTTQAQFEQEFLKSFCHAKESTTSYFLNPDALTLVIDFDHHWISCGKCGEIAPYAIANCCPSCGALKLRVIDPNTDSYVVSRKGFWRDPLKQAFLGTLVPMILHAEEHTAQLSHKDNVTGKALTEEYELRFQDITPDPQNEPVVDVLSCTTTMEVGIDIGSLVAVGLRNVPPQRENYQQRAGRAGRRGSSVSSVVTYCQGGAHDNYYYSNVAEIVSGRPRLLNVKVDNAKIARRHLHAFILQKFFEGKRQGVSSDISSSLGSLVDFFVGTGDLSLAEFQKWAADALSAESLKESTSWLGTKLEGITDVPKWAHSTATEFTANLGKLASTAKEVMTREEHLTAEDPTVGTTLLDFLFDQGMLPTYAFPTNLASFKVEEVVATRLTDKYLPQQSISRALTEYAPGRIVTIDKKDYKCEAVTANVMQTDPKRAKPLFDDPHRKPYVFCDSANCSYVEDIGVERGADRGGVTCPLCKQGSLRVMELITPEVFMPRNGTPVNEQTDDQEFSYATPAQFPVPVNSNFGSGLKLKEISAHLEVLRAPDAELVVVNKGDTKDMTGFMVCDACGKSILRSVGEGPAVHNRPYQIVTKVGRPPLSNTKCDGDWKNVFLGTRFKTDLVVLRLKIGSPLCSSTENVFSEDFVALSDALLTLADALPIAIGHRFDVDPSEFSAGYRLIHDAEAEPGFFAEIYVFDNLAGGAGYSERAAMAIEDILRKEVIETLSCSPTHPCDRSCYLCLRHYQNQYHHNKLDRFLAQGLLDFVLGKEHALADPDLPAQRRLLKALAEMAEYNGDVVNWSEVERGVNVPLTVSRRGRKVRLFVSNALVNPNVWEDPLDAPGLEVHAINAYKLTRNLPACFLDLDQWLG